MSVNSGYNRRALRAFGAITALAPVKSREYLDREALNYIHGCPSYRKHAQTIHRLFATKPQAYRLKLVTEIVQEARLVKSLELDPLSVTLVLASPIANPKVVLGEEPATKLELTKRAKFLGYGGRGFIVTRPDGSQLISHNVWDGDGIDDGTRLRGLTPQESDLYWAAKEGVVA